MASNEFDVAGYVRKPRVAAPFVRAVSQKLSNAKPDDLTPAQAVLVGRIVEQGEVVANETSERERLAPAKLRPVLNEFSTRWSGLHGALDASTHVPNDVSNRGVRATSVLESLFPTGVAFVKLDADAAWGEGQRILERIEHEGLRREIDELVGPDHLEGVTRGTQQLGEVIGAGRETRPIPSTTSVQQALNVWSQHVAIYLRSLVAQLNEDDPASMRRFLAAVSPIDEYRAGRVGKDAGDEPAPSPTTGEGPFLPTT